MPECTEGKDGGDDSGDTKPRPPWVPSAIIDFADAKSGDPLYDLVALHMTVFQCNKRHLLGFLDAYCAACGDGVDFEDVFGPRATFSRRAMWTTLLHPCNALAFLYRALPPETLSMVHSWADLEEIVWGLEEVVGDGSFAPPQPPLVHVVAAVPVAAVPVGAVRVAAVPCVAAIAMPVQGTYAANGTSTGSTPLLATAIVIATMNTTTAAATAIDGEGKNGGGGGGGGGDGGMIEKLTGRVVELEAQLAAAKAAGGSNNGGGGGGGGGGSKTAVPML